MPTFPSALLLGRTKRDNDLSLSPPFFYRGPVTLRLDQIYVLTPDQLPSDCSAAGHCLVILPALHDRAYLRKNISVITVEGADVLSIYNRVLAIFEKYDAWDDTLQDLIFHNAPIEEYLKCSLPFIGNFMSVHNANFAVLARSGSPVPVKDGLSGRDPDFIDPDFLLRVDLQSDQSVFYAKDVIYFREDRFHQEYFFLNLFSGNTAAGRLAVVSSFRPFLPQDAALVRHLGRYLEVALTCEAFSGSGTNLRRDSLLEYLGGKQHSLDKIKRLKTVSPLSKLKEDQRLYILAGVCQDGNITEQYIAYQLERALPEAVSVLFDSKIVVLCANQPKQSQAAFLEDVRAVLGKYAITAGCSNPFSDFFDLRYCYHEAEYALQYMKNSQSSEPICPFKSCAVEHFLQYGCSILPVRLICADCVRSLAEHDESSSVSYCDSLREYLNAGMNSSEAARRLNIQRNSFLARLERILNYIDLDLNDEDDRLYLLISLRLIQKWRFHKD